MVDDGTRAGPPKRDRRGMPRRRSALRPSRDAEDTDVDVQFGDLARRARLSLDLTLGQVSAGLSISRRRLTAIETGETSCTLAELSQLKPLLDLVWSPIERIVDGGPPPLPVRRLVTDEVLDAASAAAAHLRDMSDLADALREHLDRFDAVVKVAPPYVAWRDTTPTDPHAGQPPDDMPPRTTTT